jgi:hypothetical protein
MFKFLFKKKSKVTYGKPVSKTDDNSVKSKSSSSSSSSLPHNESPTTTACSTTDEKCLEKFKPEESIQYECHHQVIEQPDHHRDTTATATKIENLTKTLTRHKSTYLNFFY